jgi:hypothetical protein
MPILECFCDSKHLAVIDLVVAFGVVEYGVYSVFYSNFPLFLPILLSPSEAALAFAQSKRPSQHLTKCVLPSFFLMPIRCPGILVVHWLL